MPFPQFPVALDVLYCDPTVSFDAAMEAQEERLVGNKVADFNALLRRGQGWDMKGEH